MSEVYKKFDSRMPENQVIRYQGDSNQAVSYLADHLAAAYEVSGELRGTLEKATGRLCSEYCTHKGDCGAANESCEFQKYYVLIGKL